MLSGSCRSFRRYEPSPAQCPCCRCPSIASRSSTSHLAQAIGHAVIKSGGTVLYRSIFDLVRDFLSDEALGGQGTGLTGITAATKSLERYLRPDLLIVDDMGMKQLPKRSGEYLFEIIMRRYQVRSTMMTSNRPLEDWGKLIGDVPAATAILDRVLHNAEVITITGRSYRLRERAGKSAVANQTDRTTETACEPVEK
ncbi:MAG: ATP-binding protein [Phycisphaerae bacterium]